MTMKRICNVNYAKRIVVNSVCPSTPRVSRIAAFSNACHPCFPNHGIKAPSTFLSRRYFSALSGDSSQDNKPNGIPTGFADVPGVKSPGDKLILMFTCRVCDTRSAKKISKQAYEKGVVVCRCAGCKNLHLICDHIGIFEDPGWDINKFLQESEGKGMKYVNDDNIIELNALDILGSGHTLPIGAESDKA